MTSHDVVRFLKHLREAITYDAGAVLDAIVAVYIMILDLIDRVWKK